MSVWSIENNDLCLISLIKDFRGSLIMGVTEVVILVVIVILVVGISKLFSRPKENIQNTTNGNPVVSDNSISDEAINSVTNSANESQIYSRLEAEFGIKINVIKKSDKIYFRVNGDEFKPDRFDPMFDQWEVLNGDEKEFAIGMSVSQTLDMLFEDIKTQYVPNERILQPGVIQGFATNIFLNGCTHSLSKNLVSTFVFKS